MLKTLITTRYVTPLREGGSLPAIVEANDQGLYVLKLRGAGQGVKALIAEVIAGELGRALGFKVPELALLELDPAIGRAEPDPEIRDLLNASVGTNVGLDYLPGSVMFDPLVPPAPDALTASKLVWFDAFITNVDRTPKNPNLLLWHRQLWLIDHGAALYFHHGWDDALARAQTPFSQVKDHVLLPFASRLQDAATALTGLLSSAVIEAAIAAVPDAWLTHEPRFPTPAEHRDAYRQYFEARLGAAPIFLAQSLRARSELV
jgi:hypothetical protein